MAAQKGVIEIMLLCFSPRCLHRNILPCTVTTENTLLRKNFPLSILHSRHYTDENHLRSQINIIT